MTNPINRRSQGIKYSGIGPRISAARKIKTDILRQYGITVGRIAAYRLAEYSDDSRNNLLSRASRLQVKQLIVPAWSDAEEFDWLDPTAEFLIEKALSGSEQLLFDARKIPSLWGKEKALGSKSEYFVPSMQAPVVERQDTRSYTARQGFVETLRLLFEDIRSNPGFTVDHVFNALEKAVESNPNFPAHFAQILRPHPNQERRAAGEWKLTYSTRQWGESKYSDGDVPVSTLQSIIETHKGHVAEGQMVSLFVIENDADPQSYVRVGLRPDIASIKRNSDMVHSEARRQVLIVAISTERGGVEGVFYFHNMFPKDHQNQKEISESIPIFFSQSAEFSYESDFWTIQLLLSQARGREVLNDREREASAVRATRSALVSTRGVTLPIVPSNVLFHLPRIDKKGVRRLITAEVIDEPSSIQSPKKEELAIALTQLMIESWRERVLGELSFDTLYPYVLSRSIDIEGKLVAAQEAAIAGEVPIIGAASMIFEHYGELAPIYLGLTNIHPWVQDMLLSQILNKLAMDSFLDERGGEQTLFTRAISGRTFGAIYGALKNVFPDPNNPDKSPPDKYVAIAESATAQMTPGLRFDPDTFTVRGAVAPLGMTIANDRRQTHRNPAVQRLFDEAVQPDREDGTVMYVFGEYSRWVGRRLRMQFLAKALGRQILRARTYLSGRETKRM